MQLILKKTSNKQVGKGTFSRVSSKHAFAHGITTSMPHDGESDGGGQVMRVRNEFLTGENILRKYITQKDMSKKQRNKENLWIYQTYPSGEEPIESVWKREATLERWLAKLSITIKRTSQILLLCDVSLVSPLCTAVFNVTRVKVEREADWLWKRIWLAMESTEIKLKPTENKIDKPDFSEPSSSCVKVKRNVICIDPHANYTQLFILKKKLFFALI